MKSTTALLLLAVAFEASGASNPRRFAVIVGSNRAAEGRKALRYAQRDAASMAAALTSVGDFPAGQSKLLLDPSPTAVLAALDDALKRIAALGGENTLLLFYYSGHADEQSLYPGGLPLPLSALRARLDNPAAAVRVGIIDACRGGGWTQTKGLTPAAPFEIQRPMTLQSEGSVMISSSSGFESAHETEALEGSFFTHHFVAGLLGAAHHSGDGEITANEAFQYARELTVRDTALQAPQPQHPSFDMRLRGRSDLMLARVAQGPGTVTLHQTRGPVRILGASNGIALFELPPGPQTATLIIPTGHYMVVRRSEEGSAAADLVVSADRAISVDESSLRPTDLSQLAGKGMGLALEMPAPKNTARVEVAYLQTEFVAFEYERSLTPLLSLFVRPSMWFGRLGFVDDSSDTSFLLGGFGADLGARFFPLGTGPTGFSLSAAGGFLYGSGETGLLGFDAHAHAAYTWLFWNLIDVSGAVGGTYFHTSEPGHEDNRGTVVTRDAFVPDVRLALGVSF